MGWSAPRRIAAAKTNSTQVNSSAHQLISMSRLLKRVQMQGGARSAE